MPLRRAGRAHGGGMTTPHNTFPTPNNYRFHWSYLVGQLSKQDVTDWHRNFRITVQLICDSTLSLAACWHGTKKNMSAASAACHVVSQGDLLCHCVISKKFKSIFHGSSRLNQSKKSNATYLLVLHVVFCQPHNWSALYLSHGVRPRPVIVNFPHHKSRYGQTEKFILGPLWRQVQKLQIFPVKCLFGIG